MSVVEHRSPLKRIEIGSPIIPRRRSTDVITEAMSGVGPTERDRIWKLLVQASQDGIGVTPTELAEVAEVAEVTDVAVEGHLASVGFSDESVF